MDPRKDATFQFFQVFFFSSKDRCDDSKVFLILSDGKLEVYVTCYHRLDNNFQAAVSWLAGFGIYKRILIKIIIFKIVFHEMLIGIQIEYYLMVKQN